MTKKSNAARSLDEIVQTDGKPLIWVVRISQDIGMDMIIPTTSRGAARLHAERVCSETLGDPIQSWTEFPTNENSELGILESGETAIISRRYLETEASA